MVIFSDSQQVLPSDYLLIDVSNGRILMARQLRICDAERYNRLWQERGIPTRWMLAQAMAVAAN